MADPKMPTFHVVLGGQEPTSHRRADLHVIAERSFAPPKQLELLSTMAWKTNTVVSVTIEDWRAEQFAALIGRLLIRMVIDVRLSPSFYGNGFSRTAVLEMFESRRIAYCRRPQLANCHVGTTWNEIVALQRYEEQLREQSEDIEWLAEQVNNGPVMLLGSNDQHGGSERDVLIRSLQRRGVEFDLVVPGLAATSP